MEDTSVLHALTKQEAQTYVDQALSRSTAIKQIIKAMNKVTQDVAGGVIIMSRLPQ